jgi:nucleoside-diphosphate-sugar epimerase
LNKLVQCLNEITGQSRNASYEARRAGDVTHSLADISRARERLKYVPKTNLRTGLRITYDWYVTSSRV